MRIEMRFMVKFICFGFGGERRSSFDSFLFGNVETDKIPIAGKKVKSGEEL